MKTISYKLFLLLGIVFTFCISLNKCYAISDKFKFVIDTIGIPRYNVYGEEINEDIYYTYNVFSYSSPQDMYKHNIGQRFKEVPIYGKWRENGKIGEHDFLGRGYSGQPISNVYFPVDGVPEVTPDKWRFIEIKGAWESWNDNTKYKYLEQCEYMKNAKLMFDTINYNKNKCDPYHLLEYNITPNSIGTSRVLLNTAATWKTYGVVTINRINNLGQIRYATLAVKPMAADANVKSKFNSLGDIKISSDKESIGVNINFGASAINLTDYAKSKHIKEIFSVLYINGIEVAKVSGSKTVSVDKNVIYTVSREMFPSPGENKLHIKVVSYLYTEFNVDGLMEDTLELDLVVNVDEKIIVPVNDVEVYYQKRVNDTLVVSPLVQTNITSEAKSSGITEKQRAVAVNLETVHNIEALSDLLVSINGKMVNSEILYRDKDNFWVGFEIPSDVDNTLYTWDYLRNKLGNYFDIDFNTIGNRIIEPAKVEIGFILNGKKYIQNINLDIIDDYQKNMNYIFDRGVINKDEVDKIYKIEEL